LARLTAEILQLRLASRHLSTTGTSTGTKTTMAQRLQDANHAPDAPAQQHSINSSTSQPQQVNTLTLCQQSDESILSQQQGTRHKKHPPAAKHAEAPQNQSHCYFTAATAHQRHACYLHGIGKVVR